MALKIELAGDKERGPGYGQMRISPFTAHGPVELLVQSNQGKVPYLAGGGEWSSQEVWHEVAATSAEDGTTVLALGPALVDPIATQPGRVAFQATVRCGANRDVGRVVLRHLLPSAAMGERPDSGGGVVVHDDAADKEKERQREPEPAQELDRQPPIELSLDSERQLERRQQLERDRERPQGAGKLAPVIIGAAALLAAALGGAWYAGLLPFGKDGEPVAESPSTAAPQTPPAAIASLQDVNAFLQTNPAAHAAHAAGEKLMQAGKPDLAMLVYQYGARQGGTDSAMAVARMYDPETWSKDTSPMPQADAETAAYWYEPAAQSGNAEAQRQMGRILLETNPSGFLHDKGMEWLNKAAAAGDAKAKTLLQGK